MQETQEQTSSFLKEVFGIGKVMAITALTVLFITRFLVMVVYVPSSSMEPTLETGSIVLANPRAYKGERSPQRGDVIIFKRNNADDDRFYVKRVVATQGQIVEIINGETFINGEKYDEPWLKEKPQELNFGPFTVGQNCVFAMGDNRNNSFDCRYWPEHFIKVEDVRAKVFLQNKK